VDRDRYRNAGGELRVVHAFSMNGRSGALATGLRVSRGLTTRERGRGADGGAFVLDFTGARTLALDFTTHNVAGFAELSVDVADGIALAPGVRVEQVRMRAGGTYARASASTFLPVAAPVTVDDRSLERMPLAGLGASITRWQRTLGVEFYGNVAQAWRPVLFSERFPNDLVAVDPAMRSARGVSADVGARGQLLGSRLAYDVSLFHLDYDGRVGTLSRATLGADSVRYPSGLRTNAGRSWHRGFEAFTELDLSAVQRGASLFTSVGRTVATYTRGAAAGRQVEYSPDWVVRSGLTLRGQDARGERWRGTLQGSHVSTVYSDASNTVFQADGLQGIIPAYTVWDLSLSTRLPRLLTRDLRGVRAELNVNNLLDRRYFTRRAAGYPGPGIIPAEPRTVLAGVRIETGR
jgi:Fe(3+) dicitrate transport protein